MKTTSLTERISEHLDILCNRCGNRSTGSPGNRKATAYVRDTLATFGFQVQCPEFACLDWKGGKALLHVGRTTFSVHAGPFSLPFDGTAPLEAASTLRELSVKNITGKLLLLHGRLAREPLFPKKFVFYNPPRHRRIISLLERRKPAAIIAATGSCPSGAGAIYPFPLIEDGDFDIPSVYLKDVDGEKLLRHVGRPVRLASAARRIPAKGCNVIASRGGPGPQRVVITAHVDARKGTPGALDNASGTATLLAIGELLREHVGERQIELAALNGEDYYAVPGQMDYLRANQGRWGEIHLAVNMDDVGYREGRTAYSFYGCTPTLRARCSRILAGYPGLTPGPSWVQGDHSLFVQQGVPAAAFISDRGEQLMREVIHTRRDRVELVDPSRLAELAEAVARCAVAC